MLLRVKLVRCVLSVDALIPTAASTYQLYRRCAEPPRRAPLRARHAPHRQRRGGARPPPPPRDARPRRLCAFVPPGAARSPLCPPLGRVCPPPPLPNAYPGPRRCAAPPARRDRATAPAFAPAGPPAAEPAWPRRCAGLGAGKKAKKVGRERGSAADTPAVSSFPRCLPFLASALRAATAVGVGTETRGFLAMVLGGSCRGCTPRSLLSEPQGESRGEEPVPEGA
ncbi:atherin-like [Pseudopipra pipra]|uniref:atherin-like n=1 Tax=Pseudopipra pipra TaxID=415032 RepID=UPI00313A4538